MKYTILLVLSGLLFFAGCKQQPPAADQPPPAQVPPVAPPPQMDAPPAIPQTPPPPPPVVTNSYLKGYHDGYFGTWLRPAAWVVVGEYRHGWSAGSYDRQHGLPNAHP